MLLKVSNWFQRKKVRYLSREGINDGGGGGAGGQKKRRSSSIIKRQDGDDLSDSLDDTAKTDGTAASTNSKISTLFEGVRQKARQSFSVVLTPEDLKVLEVQNEILAVRKKRYEAQRAQRTELNNLRRGLRDQKATIQQKLRDGLDAQEYEAIAQECLKELADMKTDEGKSGNDDDLEEHGNVGGGFGEDDEEEVDFDKALTETIRLVKTQHSSDMQDRVNKMVQEQTNDEIMRMYNMEGTIKEDFGEREAKMLSHVVQMDGRLGEIRAGQEEVMEVYETMKARYEKTAQEHVSRLYKALRDAKPGEQDGSRVTTSTGAGGPVASKPKGVTGTSGLSYSDRLLQANAEEQEERRKQRESIKKVSGAALIEGDGDEEDEETQHKVEIVFDIGDNAEANGSERSERTTGSRSGHGHRRVVNDSTKSERTAGSSIGARRLSGVRAGGATHPRPLTTRRTSLTRPSAASTAHHARTALASRATSPRVGGVKSHSTTGGARTNLPARRVVPAGGK